MSDGPSITFADDAKLVAMIAGAKRRVVLLAPGVAEAVAAAIHDAWQRLGGQQVTAILDVDPEVCRLGFGTLAPVEKLRAAASAVGTMLHHQPGVRIGVLVCEDRTLVFSPTPLLVEAGSTQPERPNAIELGGVPAQMAKDLGLGQNPDAERTVGLDPVRPDQIEKVKEDLAAAPPVKFDLARRVPGYGTVVLRANKEKFEEAVAALRVKVNAYANGVKDQIEGLIKGSCASVVAALLPAVERNPPDQYCKTHGPKPPRSFLAKRLAEDVEWAFGTAESIINEMEVKTIFKDVAYESLVDTKFLKVARRAMPDVKWLHDEFDASRVTATLSDAK